MPDWLQLLKSRLGALGLDPQREAEIVTEVATHLDDLYENFRQEGLGEEEAAQRALASVTDWCAFRRQIRSAEKWEGAMNQRTKSVWLPGLCAVAICYISMQVVGFATSKLMADPVGIKVVGSILLAVLFLGFVGAGSMAAYLSKRMGGGLRHQVLGALLPVGMWIAFALSGLAAFSLFRAAFPHTRFELLLLAVTIATTAVCIPLLVGVLLVRLQTWWSGRNGPDRQAGGENVVKTGVGIFARWLHRFGFSHA